MLKKIFVLIVILILFPFSLYGCYDADDLEQLAYVVALGLDVGENNAIKLTLQFAAPTSSDGSGTSQSEENTITSVDCSSIDAGIAIINSYISKKVNLSHCRIIVISETL